MPQKKYSRGLQSGELGATSPDSSGGGGTNSSVLVAPGTENAFCNEHHSFERVPALHWS
ncbi:Hypothetical protein FKW44_025047 [Caligus rogercresseyi]|uniref:Uncharacterized protein n=1 Tax=Caligus rogercresseyi TaxID=217165 RepID=A0A7T8JTF8_CALRO|nr:Hypothetical protein FKW44_025047 [Caligus rogercresseyi]